MPAILRITILIIGVYACSTAVIMIKACTIHPFVLATYRQLIAVVILFPFYIRALPKVSPAYILKNCRMSMVPAILLALHFMSWNIGARMTLAANASLIVNMVPVIMPFLLFLFYKEKISMAETIGTALSLAGVIILALGDFHLSKETFWGDFISFLSMLAFALYLAFARKSREEGSLWLYIVPLYFISGIICLITSIFFTKSLFIFTRNEYMILLGLAIFPTVIGHSILNLSMRTIPGQLVSITNLGQFIFAGIMGFFILDESPKFWFFFASFFVVAGAYIAIRGTLKSK